MTNKDTFGNRLRLVRERERFTRPALSKETGIPLKSLEKFEYDELEPNISRLKLLAETLNVTSEYLMNGSREAEQVTVPEKISPDQPSNASIAEQLQQLDEMRLKGFSKFWRSAPRLFSIVEAEIGKLDAEDLLDLAEARQLAPISLEGPLDQEQLGEVQQRILDTAYFGIDLHRIQTKALEDLSENHDLDPDEKGILFSSWSNELSLISALREPLRMQSFAPNPDDLCDEKKYPKREGA